MQAADWKVLDLRILDKWVTLTIWPDLFWRFAVIYLHGRLQALSVCLHSCHFGFKYRARPPFACLEAPALAMVTQLICSALVASWIQTTAADALVGAADMPRYLRAARSSEQHEVSLSVGCSADDETMMSKLGGGNSRGTFPKYLAECGSKSFKVFSGLDNSTFTACVTSSTNISLPCARCFLSSAEFGADHCKWPCFWGSWCGDECLKCMETAEQATRKCAGVTVPEAKSCM